MNVENVLYVNVNKRYRFCDAVISGYVPYFALERRTQVPIPDGGSEYMHVFTNLYFSSGADSIIVENIDDDLGGYLRVRKWRSEQLTLSQLRAIICLADERNVKQLGVQLCSETGLAPVELGVYFGTYQEFLSTGNLYRLSVSGNGNFVVLPLSE